MFTRTSHKLVYIFLAHSLSLSRSVPEIHKHVAGTLSNQQTNNLSLSDPSHSDFNSMWPHTKHLSQSRWFTTYAGYFKWAGKTDKTKTDLCMETCDSCRDIFYILNVRQWPNHIILLIWKGQFQIKYVLRQYVTRTALAFPKVDKIPRW